MKQVVKKIHEYAQKANHHSHNPWIENITYPQQVS